jgi:hypothetical protein
MSKQSKLIVACAAVGLIVAVVVFMYVNFLGEFNGTLYTAFAILCPPSILCIPLREVMKEKIAFWALWSLISAANSASTL